jgi:hypothetical protein
MTPSARLTLATSACGSLSLLDEQASLPDPHSPHRGAAADHGLLIRRPLLEIRAVKSSILERNVLRIGDVFAL